MTLILGRLRAAPMSRSQRVDRATDPATSPWELAELAGDREPDVRLAVAANPGASLLTLRRLQADTDDRVRVVATAARDDGQAPR